VLREYGVDGRLLLDVKSLYPFLAYPEVCVRVGRAKSRPFAGGVGLRQGCVVTPFFIFYISDGNLFLLSRAS